MTDAPASAPEAPLVTEPAGGTPALVSSVQGVLEWCQRVKPEDELAIDVERASSFRYSARAYLVQVKSPSAGILLFDPLAFQLPRTFIDVCDSHPWILHASRQDLPSLAMLGLTPPSLFDTEVAARLLGLTKVGLGALTEDLLGVRLAKEHSSANWSKRPLPSAWLDYAALDVEYLIELKNELEARLLEAGKAEWAREEFAFESTFSRHEEDPEPWRSMRGLGTLRHPKQLAVARALWEHRDSIARGADIAPFMVMRDKNIIALAKASSRGKAAFEQTLPRTMKHRDQWWKVARSGREVPAAHLPSRLPASPFPHQKSWSSKHPEALKAYTAVREELLLLAEKLAMPVENLISPGHVRLWVFQHYGEGTPPSTHYNAETVATELVAAGARRWQAEHVAPVIVSVLGS